LLTIEDGLNSTFDSAMVDGSIAAISVKQGFNILGLLGYRNLPRLPQGPLWFEQILAQQGHSHAPI
jgi:hypothetical protein